MSPTKPAVFSTDPEALAILHACDYSIKITGNSESSLPRPVRVYIDGIFDLFHRGHAQALMQAKNAFSEVRLIVGVCSDAMVCQNKGLKPFQNEVERYAAVRNCRYVDEVVAGAPWMISEMFIARHKIDFIAHDTDPYPFGSIADIYELAKKKDIFLPIKRTEGVSSADLVLKIVREYEEYARRSRGKGYTAKELTTLFSMKRK